MEDIEDITDRNNDHPIDITKYNEIIKEFLDSDDYKKNINKFMSKMQSKHKMQLTKVNLLRAYMSHCVNNHQQHDPAIIKLLQRKPGRSQHGVMPVAVVMSPYPLGQTFTCKWDCSYCPNEEGQPRSYLKKEPGVQRANQNNFDPVLQMRDRLGSYFRTGHPCDKLEIIILGGTWDSYPEEYRTDFITKLYFAANTFYDSQKVDELRECGSLDEEKEINAESKCQSHIIGITIETRPDCITGKSLKYLRRLGVTRIQMGVQHIDQRLLHRINRQCKTETVYLAIKNMLNCGFKYDIHIMPDLPRPFINEKQDINNVTNEDIDQTYSVYEADRCMFAKIVNVNDDQIKPDQIKIYPCEIVPFSRFEKEYNDGIHEPYAEQIDPKENLSRLNVILMEFKSQINPWVRLNRVIRDIPNDYIIGGNKNVNMRQELAHQMAERGLHCKCIRCREVGGSKISPDSAVLKVRKYRASDGDEYFVSFETDDEKTLFGFVRLRLSRLSGIFTHSNGEQETIFVELDDCAMIRELHVYGDTTPVNGNNGEKKHQHVGFGTRLLEEVFKIAREHKYEKISVIAGNGVTEYYQKFGFENHEFFMVKYF